MTQHPGSTIRREVARAVQFLRHELFDKIVTALVVDADLAVRAEAQTSLVRHRERAQADLFGMGADPALEELLSTIEGARGGEGRRAVLSAAQCHAYAHLRAFGHERARIRSPLVTEASIPVQNE